jgi:transcriptional antiterminator Rof (Rho-off)
MSDYEPIACGVHEQYQLAVMRGAWLDLEWIDGEGRRSVRRLLPKDVRTRNGAEYLTAEDQAGAGFEIRLDWIKRASWVRDGVSILD